LKSEANVKVSESNIKIKAFTKQQVQSAFNKAAHTYDAAAVLQQEVCKRLLERLDYIKITPKTILDIGSGTGQGSRGLMKQYPDASIISMDLAENMLKINRTQSLQKGIIYQLRCLLKRPKKQQFVCADAEQLPFSDASVDVIYSSLTIQWCLDLDRLFSEFRRVLKPGGLLMFTTFGLMTLKELKASWAAVSDKVHVNEFTDMHDIGDALYRAKVENPVMDCDTIIINYTSVKQILMELKAVGAYNQNQGRETALTGKQRLKLMYQAYEQFQTSAGYPATYEVLYGHAWNPKTPIQNTQQLNNGQQTSISLAQLKSNLR
jgi:malonyl-CoA O-methyltransferase